MTTPKAETAREATADIETLAEILRLRGDLTSGRIRRALHDAPRHQFAPARGWCAPDGSGLRRPLDKDHDSGSWWNGVYADASIVTQADDGVGDPSAGTGEATSSLSSPGAVVTFLELLNVQPGERILEIGTGTGWTAALLTVLGAHVTTIEVDPDIAAAAAARLERHGYDVEVLAQDGASGVPGREPFDAVHVTCGVTAVPYEWVAQTRPGGRIVAPWMPEWGEGHKLNLTVTGDGRASGRLAGSANYMMLRGQRTTYRLPGDWEGARETSTRLHPRLVTHSGHGADVAITGLLPDVVAVPGDGDQFELELVTVTGGSWAYCAESDTGEHQVLQAGSRNLWDEVADVYERWVGWGRPDRSRFGMTVSPDGQELWLDEPDGALAS